MKEKTVSIIIPVYNTGKYLEKCLTSVLSQTYQKKEIILINDASTDDSDSICKRYAERSDLFKYINHKENKGQTVSILDGLDIAEGEWMVFLDSDDYLVSDALETMVAIAEKDKSPIVLSCYETIDDNGNKKYYNANIADGLYSVNEFVNLFYNKIPLNVLSCIGTKLYSLDFVRNVKPETPRSLRTNYDIAFILDALTVAPSISYTNKVSYIYYQRNDSITHKYRNNMFKNLTGARSKLLPLLKSCGCYEEKKIDYHLAMFGIIIWSITQEVRFSKGYKHFKEVFYLIYNDPDTEETINVLSNVVTDNNRRLFLFLLKNNLCLSTYLMLNARYSLKRIL